MKDIFSVKWEWREDGNIDSGLLPEYAETEEDAIRLILEPDFLSRKKEWVERYGKDKVVEFSEGGYRSLAVDETDDYIDIEVYRLVPAKIT